LEGSFEHGTYDPSLCTENGDYSGDKRVLASYMHSITSTKRYVILPLTSSLYNPCRLPPLASKYDHMKPQLHEDLEKASGPDRFFATDMPIRFLVFDKIEKRFITEQPIESFPATFITHQFNAYEDDDGTLVADMIGEIQNGTSYDVLLVDHILKHPEPLRSGLWRFRLDLVKNVATRENLIKGKDQVNAEFCCYNRNFMERKYKFGYLLTNPYKTDSSIQKLSLDGGSVVAEFVPPHGLSSDTVLREPWFVPKPDSSPEDEDNGVVFTLGGNVATGNTTLYVLDGKTLALLARAEIPTFIPFGFHNRFYDRKDL